ncbi:MAG: hypothetical protein R3244_10115 [Thermoanaerobaculia bacterium]|nr:hypothetical protein [Thermoanaerobaculia bacterium]
MLSGFNTDVQHQGTVYHVQTEDKGRGNPVIESLVYVGGRVVVSKREEYADLVAGNGDDSAIAERMERQHRVLVAAIKSGRFDEQLGSMVDSAEVAVASDERAAEIARAMDALNRADPTESAVERAARARSLGDQIDPSGSLDEVVLRYLDAEAAREHLVLKLEDDGDIAMGRKAFLALKTTSSRSGAPVEGADVVVRMISTVREPQILAEGTSDRDGELFLNVQIPLVRGGSAALIISAASGMGRAELKHLL